MDGVLAKQIYYLHRFDIFIHYFIILMLNPYLRGVSALILLKNIKVATMPYVKHLVVCEANTLRESKVVPPIPKTNNLISIFFVLDFALQYLFLSSNLKLSINPLGGTWGITLLCGDTKSVQLL